MQWTLKNKGNQMEATDVYSTARVQGGVKGGKRTTSEEQHHRN